MNFEELSFFNQQLAAMLKSGLPLEGSLRQLSSTMRRGDLRSEIEQLERDLSQGVPLDEAIGRRKLPGLYIAIVRVGVKGNDLPGVLTLLADYYRRQETTWMRLKGLLLYPAIVLVTSLIVSTVIAFLFSTVVFEGLTALGDLSGPSQNPFGPSGFLLMFRIWLPPLILTAAAAIAVLCISVRSIRYRLRWRLPGFREAALSQLASALSLMIENGCDAKTALELVEQSEADASARSELRQWRERLAAGTRKFADIAQGKLVPPMFVWLVASAGENWAAGFRRAAEIYGARANYRIELLLYAALPVSILLVAGLVATEVAPVIKGFVGFMNMLSNMSGE